MYEWLNSYREIENNIALLEFEIERYNEELERWCDNFDLGGKYTLEKTSRASRLEKVIADLERRLAFEMNLKFKLDKIINGFDGLENIIMKMKYVDRLSLKQIAYSLGYSEGYVRNIHSEIIRSAQLNNEMKLIDFFS